MTSFNPVPKIKELGRRLPQPPKGYRHWTVVALLITLGVVAGEWLGEKDVWIKLRYKIYKYQQEVSSLRRPWAKRTALVLIGDEEYWKGELARRVPIKRDYLARLLQTVAAADPAVIALDFDFRSPTPDGSLLDHREYIAETDALVQAIRETNSSLKIVLPRSITDSSKEDIYTPVPSVFDSYELPGNVLRGYIELPYDLREVPLPVDLVDGSELDSFASAVVRATGDDWALRVAMTGKDALPYAAFLERKSFPVHAAREVMRLPAKDLQARLQHKIVIIGAGWRQKAYGFGGPVDGTASPIGRVEKVFMHANYVEALLNSDSRIYEPLPHHVAIAIEAGLALVVALFFAGRFSPRARILGATGACVGMIIANYLLSENFGLFFDFFIPFVLLTGHSVYEQVMVWKERSSELEELEQRLKQAPGPPRAFGMVGAPPRESDVRIPQRRRRRKKRRGG